MGTLKGNKELNELSELTVEEKDKVSEKLLAYCKRYPALAYVAANLKGVSVGTISNILNRKYENISDKMFRNILSQVDINSEGWQVQETEAYKEMMFTFKDAQQYRNVTWIVGDAGCGKTTAAKMYLSENRNVFYVLCSEDMLKRDFVFEMARQIGIPTDGYKIRAVLDMIIEKLINTYKPLLIFDEGDKLTDNVFNYFISLYNLLESNAGMVFLSTSYIKRRMENGLRFNKKGYKEINSRIGRKFYELEPTNANDVYAICVANGVEKESDIKDILNDASSCEYDLRRVKKAIHKTIRKNQIKQK